jgi:hypothetical protein
MDRRIENALELLREAGACFPDSFAALDGAKAIADALDRASKEALREAEQTSIVPDESHRERARH